MPRLLSLAAAAAAAAVFAVGFGSSSASAQVVYEPVEYQHRSHGRTYYYGGSDPAVTAFADAVSCARASIRDGSRYYDADVGYTAARKPFGVRDEKPVVYSDCLPFANAHFYGFTPADARNEAYAAAPRHFTKAGLLRAAVPVGGGTYVVPGHAAPVRPVVVRRVAPATTTTAPATRPGSVIVIPKRMLDRKVSSFDKHVVSAAD